MIPYNDPNLEIRCLVALALELYNYEKIDNFIRSEIPSHYSIDPEDWEEMAHERVVSGFAEGDMRRLVCPKWPVVETERGLKRKWPLQSKLTAMIANIYREIIKFFVKNVTLFRRRGVINFKESFVFDPIGTLNHHKTYEKILQNDMIGNRYRFFIACSKCREDYVFDTWNKMIHSERRFFDRIDGQKDDLRTELTYMWVRIIHNEEAATDNFPNDRFYEFSVAPEAIVYALQFEPPERRSVCLDLCVKNCIRRKDDFPFLLQHLNTEERNDVHRDFAFEILKSYLTWPLVLDFMDMAEILYSHLTIKEFLDLFVFISRKRYMGFYTSHRYIFYMDIYVQFFKCAPTHLKVRVETGDGDLEKQIVREVKTYAKSNESCFYFRKTGVKRKAED